jgi:hypothetical protein
MVRRSLWVALLCLGALAACSTLPIDVGPPRDAGEVVVTTAAPPPPNLGPAPEETPIVPTQAIVTLRPGGEPNDQQLAFMEAQQGYVEGSGKVEAIYPGADGPLAILTWESEGGEVLPRIGDTGPQSCHSIGPVDQEPSGWGCGGPLPDDPRDGFIRGMGYTYEVGGPNMIEVRHGPGVQATVVELIDGRAFVIRPGDSSISYHEWNGAPSARVTVFWQDGSSESELTSPP